MKKVFVKKSLLLLGCHHTVHFVVTSVPAGRGGSAPPPYCSPQSPTQDLDLSQYQESIQKYCQTATRVSRTSQFGKNGASEKCESLCF